MHLSNHRDDLVRCFDDLDRDLRITVHPCSRQPLRNQILRLTQREALNLHYANEWKLDPSVQTDTDCRRIVSRSVDTDRHEVTLCQVKILLSRIQDGWIGRPY